MRRNAISIATKNTGVRNRPNSVTPEHAGEHRDAHRVTHLAAGAACGDERHHAHDECERGHQDRPQPQPARFDGRLDHAHALLDALARELDDQDRVLAREADQHDEADLREHVVVPAAQPDAEQREQQAHRHDQHDRERQRPALVLRGEDQEDQQHAQREDRGATALEADFCWNASSVHS